MSTPGSKAVSIGLVIMLLSVSTGMHSGGFGLLLCFLGVLVATTLVAAGVRTADGPAPMAPIVFRGARALAVFVRRSTTAVGLVMASCAVKAVSGEKDPMLCIGMFALLLLGLTLINNGARAE